MQENKEDNFDIDEYLNKMDEETDALVAEADKFIVNTPPIELSEDDKKIALLEKQIEAEREKESNYVDSLSEEQKEKYMEEKYRITDELAQLNNAKKAELSTKKGRKE